ncbi:MAG: maturation protein [Sanya fiers-like virus 54]|nr:MAG: maturation protein [Sanya fiers-like virus 54]
MKPKNVLQYGFRSYVRSDNTNPVGVTVLQSGPKSRDLVTQTSMRGNYISPTSYSSETLLLNYPVGTSQVVTTYPTIPGKYISQVQSGCIAFDSTADWSLPKIDDGLYNTALNRLNAKTRGTLDLTLAISQAGSTARMLNATKRAEDYFQKYPESKWRAMIRDPARAWLEFVYGWKPLAQDIYDSAQELANVALGANQFDASAKSEIASLGRLGCSFQFYGKTYADLVGVHRQLAFIRVVLKNDDLSFTRFGSVNPGSVTWENLPYSFVVDWVYDVSNYLRAMETAMLLSSKFKSGYVVRSYITQGSYKFDKRKTETYSDRIINYRIQASGTFKLTHHSRQALGSYPLPRLPSFNTEISAPRLLNLAALIAAKFKKYLPKTNTTMR